MKISQTKIETARKVFLKKCKHIDEENLSDAFYGSERKIKKLDNAIPGSLKESWQDIRTMTAMLRDYSRGNYRELPWATISAVAAALIYFVSPVDVIPDFIAGLGFVDDASVIALCVSMVQKDITAYRKRTEKSGNEEIED